MEKANKELREEINRAGIKYWRVARELGLHDSNFTRMLRWELPLSKKEAVRAAIRNLLVRS